MEILEEITAESSRCYGRFRVGIYFVVVLNPISMPLKLYLIHRAMRQLLYTPHRNTKTVTTLPYVRQVILFSLRAVFIRRVLEPSPADANCYGANSIQYIHNQFSDFLLKIVLLSHNTRWTGGRLLSLMET